MEEELAPSRAAEFSCGELLLIPLMRDAVVLAGKAGLGKAISKVNVMEVPDVIGWVRAGELLVTTGYPFRDNPEAIAELIPQLVEKGVAALGVKTHRFIEAVPEQAIEAANQYGFPIIELPASISFSDLVRDIMERVLSRETDRLLLLQDRVQSLMQLLLDGKRLEDFLEKLEQLILNPVILVDSFNQLILSPRTRSLFGGHLDTMSWDRLYQSLDSGVLEIADRPLKTHTCMIKRYQNSSSLLALLEWQHEITAIDAITIDRVGVIAGLELMNQQVRRVVEAKYIDQFLQEWLTGRIPAVSDLFLRAEACGVRITHSASMTVGIACGFRREPEPGALKSRINLLRQSVHAYSERLMYTVVESELVVFITGRHGHAEEKLKELEYEGILAFLRQSLGEPELTLCLGKEVYTPEDVQFSYAEAVQVRNVSRVCRTEEPIVTSVKLGILLPLYLLIDKPEIEQFMGRLIDPLELYDGRHRANLIETLTVYFNAGGNARVAADQLFTHYNTIVYRLKQVCSLLELDLDHPDSRLQLQLAVKLHEIRMGGTSAVRPDKLLGG